MVQHVMTKHLIQFVERFNVMETKMTALTFENKALREEISSFQSTISNLQDQVETLTQANKKKDVDIESLKSIVEELQEERDERDRSKITPRNFDDQVERDGPTKQNVDHLYKDELKVSLKPRPTTLTDNAPSKFRVAVDDDLRALEPPPYREPVYSLTGMPGQYMQECSWHIPTVHVLDLSSSNFSSMARMPGQYMQECSWHIQLCMIWICPVAILAQWQECLGSTCKSVVGTFNCVCFGSVQ